MTILRKTICLLTREQKRRAIALLAMMGVGMILEMMGVGLAIPVVGILMNGSYLEHVKGAGFVARYFNVENHEKVIYLAIIGLLSAYLLKNLYLGFLAWRQVKFASEIQVELSQRLFGIYLNQPYSFHLQRNSAQLVRNIIGEVNLFSGAISHILQITAEGLVLAGVGILLFTVEPWGALMVFAAIGVVGWLLFAATKNYSTRWGAARQIHDGLRIQFLQEGIGGVKDVKLLGRESAFLNKHDQHNTISAKAGELQTTIQQIPRLVLELLAIMGFGLLVVIMVSQGKSMDTIMPTLGLFAAAAFRLMPSASRILSSLQTLRFSLPVVETLHEEIALQQYISDTDHAGGVIKLEKSIELNAVSFEYEAADCPALDSLSFEIRRGEAVGIIGASGSGKSTLVDVIMGLLNPTGGRILVDGKDIAANMRTWQDRIGYVPQNIFLTDDTLRHNIAFGLSEDKIDESAVTRAVEAAQLSEFIANLPDGLETQVGERGVRLSGGQRQRIGIARALYHDPDFLVLDEATSALDTSTEMGIMQAVNQMLGSKTILIVAHRLSTVETCNRIYRMESGRIVASGTPAEIIGKQGSPITYEMNPAMAQI